MKIIGTFASALLLLAGLCDIAAQTSAGEAKTPSDTTQASASTVGERYLIGFQDVLNVQVHRHPDLNQTVAVGPAGTISLFKIDRPIVAACKTEDEVAAEIRKAYMQNYLRDPLIKVSVAEQRSQSVSIFGAVEKPQTFFIGRRIHLLELLAMAGGPKKEAGTRISIARAPSLTTCAAVQGTTAEAEQLPGELPLMHFKVRDVREGKVMFWMQPGDVVSVSEADQVYVYGNVNRQGAFKYGEPITLTQAIVLAEGMKGAAKKEKVRVIRLKDGSSEPEELVFNLNDIDKRKIRDPYLEPNDIVAVSEDRTRSIILGLANAIKGSVPNVIYRLPMP